MLGIGGTELVLILLAGFLLFGPEKLPQMGRTVGRAIKQFRNASDDMNKKFREEIYDPFKESVEPMKKKLQEEGSPIKEDFDAIKASFTETQEAINAPLADIKKEFEEEAEALKDPLGLKDSFKETKELLNDPLGLKKDKKEQEKATSQISEQKQIRTVPLPKEGTGVAASLYGLTDEESPKKPSETPTQNESKDGE